MFWSLERYYASSPSAHQIDNECIQRSSNSRFCYFFASKYGRSIRATNPEKNLEKVYQGNSHTLSRFQIAVLLFFLIDFVLVSLGLIGVIPLVNSTLWTICNCTNMHFVSHAIPMHRSFSQLARMSMRLCSCSPLLIFMVLKGVC